MYTEEQLNYFRLAKSLVHFTNQALKLFFVAQWNLVHQPWTNSRASGQFFRSIEIAGNSKVSLPNYRSCLQIIATGDLSKWDNTTLFAVLLWSHAISGRYRSKRYRTKPYNATEYIDELRIVRNNFAHIKTLEIPETDFQVQIDIVVEALTFILPSGHTIVSDVKKIKYETNFTTSEVIALKIKLIQERVTVCKLEKQIKSLQQIIFPKSKTETRISRIYPNTPNFDKAYCDMIETSNDLTYSFKFDALGEYLSSQKLHTDDTELLLYCQIQECKGLNHQGKKKEALQLLNDLTGVAHRATNGNAILARIYVFKAFIYNDWGESDHAWALAKECENFLYTTQSYQDAAGMYYAQANVLLSKRGRGNILTGKTPDNYEDILILLDKTLEATEKSEVDNSVFTWQAVTRKILFHLGFTPFEISESVRENDIKTAKCLIKRMEENKEQLSERNILYLNLCNALLFYRNEDLKNAEILLHKALKMAEEKSLSHEIKLIYNTEQKIAENSNAKMKNKMVSWFDLFLYAIGYE